MTKNLRAVFMAAAGLSLFTIGYGNEAPGTSSVTSDKTIVPTMSEARRQAEVLHDAMHHTLHVVHHHFYREDQGLPIPAETLKDVFAELEAEQHITLRWLAVEGQAMNTDHKPRDDFERAAAKALIAGKPSYEIVEETTYRRAAPVTLTNHCLKCHVPDRKSTEDRKAGLIISMGIRME